MAVLPWVIGNRHTPLPALGVGREGAAAAGRAAADPGPREGITEQVEGGSEGRGVVPPAAGVIEERNYASFVQKLLRGGGGA